MRKAICKYCGEKFEYSTRGKKREYCKKAECLRQAKNEIQRKWYANKVQKELNGEKIKILNKTNETQVIYSNIDRIDNRISNDDFSDVIEVARELGAIRFKIQEMLNKVAKKQSFYDKEDQDFLHKLENLEELTDKEAIDMIVKEKQKREARRGYKIKQSLLMRMLQGIMKNPNAYVIETLKNRDNFKYIPRIKENETI